LGRGERALTDTAVSANTTNHRNRLVLPGFQQADETWQQA
jgi:hypothetical protein